MPLCKCSFLDMEPLLALMEERDFLHLRPNAFVFVLVV